MNRDWARANANWFSIASIPTGFLPPANMSLGSKRWSPRPRGSACRCDRQRHRGTACGIAAGRRATNDEVILPAITFVATANAVSHAAPFHISSTRAGTRWGSTRRRSMRILSRSRFAATADGQQTDRPASIRHHPGAYLRASVAMAPLAEIAEKYGLVVVEDATESLARPGTGRRAARSGIPPCSASTATRSSPPAAAA